MSKYGQLFKRMKETEERFTQRKSEREAAEKKMNAGDFVGANLTQTLQSRMKRLGMNPALTEGITTRSFVTPRPVGAPNIRAAIENLTYERILDNNDLMPISYLLAGQEKSRSIGRVHIKDKQGRGVGFGTGFMVSPRLLLTNNHVLTSDREAKFSQIEFDFELDLSGELRKTVTFALDPEKFFLTNKKLDFTLVAVSPISDSGQRLISRGWSVLPETDGLIVKGEYVSIIQHPNGEAKQIALRENRVVDLLENFAHYHTDTAPGSSGSPVYNDQWELVALHHSGVPERKNGKIQSVDGQNWEEWMGEHRIKWIANEGVFIERIVEYVKNTSALSSSQKLVRDELFNAGPGEPLDTEPPEEDVIPVSNVTDSPDVAMPGPFLSNSSNQMTWTIPLQVTVNVGAPLQNTAPANPDSLTTAPAIDVSGVADVEDDSELQMALDELDSARERTYYDEERDVQDRHEYYSEIDAEELTSKQMYHQLSDLITKTHENTPRYMPRLQVYPWVDLHPDLKIRSIYSGKDFDAAELIREDFRIEQELEMLRQEMRLNEQGLTEELDLLEAQNPYNCEHVVPQSWFNKQEPMRGDLHHLFACESGCNSFRSNIAYFEFSDFDEVTRTQCGKREGNRFEPSSGKGPVARALLYFLLRYPDKIDDPEEFPSDRISMLLQWHSDDLPGEYEKHRNQAVFMKQGNRNPLIDFPEWAGKIKFELGLR